MREMSKLPNKSLIEQPLLEQALKKIVEGKYNDSMQKKIFLLVAAIGAMGISIDANIVFGQGGVNGAMHLNPAIYTIIPKEIIKDWALYSGYISNVIFNGVFPILSLAALTSWWKMRKLYGDLGLETENFLITVAKEFPSLFFAVIGSLPFVFFVKFASDQATIGKNIEVRRMIEMSILITLANLDGLDTALGVMKFLYKTPRPFMQSWWKAATHGFHEIMDYRKLNDKEILNRKKQIVLEALDEHQKKYMSYSIDEPRLNECNLLFHYDIKENIKNKLATTEIDLREKVLKEKSIRYLINSLVCATTMYAVSGYYKLIIKTCGDRSKDLNAYFLVVPFSLMVLMTFVPLIAGSAVKTGEFITETAINKYNDFKAIGNEPLDTASDYFKRGFDYFKEIVGVLLMIGLVFVSLGSGFSAFDLDTSLVAFFVLLGVGLANDRGAVDLGKKIKDNWRHVLDPLASRLSWANNQVERQEKVEQIKLFSDFVKKQPAEEVDKFVESLSQLEY